MNFSLSLFLIVFSHYLSLPLNNIFTVIFSDFFSSLLFTEFHLESSSHSDFTNPIEETKATSASFYRFHSRVLRIAIRSTPPSPTYEWKFHRQPTHPTRSFSALCCCCCGVEKKNRWNENLRQPKLLPPPAQRARMERQKQTRKKLWMRRPTQYRSKARWWRQTGSQLDCVGGERTKNEALIWSCHCWYKSAERRKRNRSAKVSFINEINVLLNLNEFPQPSSSVVMLMCVVTTLPEQLGGSTHVPASNHRHKKGEKSHREKGFRIWICVYF